MTLVEESLSVELLGGVESRRMSGDDDGAGDAERDGNRGCCAGVFGGSTDGVSEEDLKVDEEVATASVAAAAELSFQAGAVVVPVKSPARKSWSVVTLVASAARSRFSAGLATPLDPLSVVE